MFYPFVRTTALILFAIFYFETTSIAGKSGKKEEQQEKAKNRANKRFQKIRSLSLTESEDQKQKERNQALFQLFEKSSHVSLQLSLHDLSSSTMLLNHFANQDHKIGNYLLSLPQYQQKQLVLTMCLLFELLNHEELGDKRIFEIKTEFDDITVYEHPIQESWFDEDNKASAFRVKNLLNKLEASEDLASFLDSFDTRIARTKNSQGNDLKTCFFLFISLIKKGSDPSKGFIEFYDLLQAKI